MALSDMDLLTAVLPEFWASFNVFDASTESNNLDWIAFNPSENVMAVAYKPYSFLVGKKGVIYFYDFDASVMVNLVYEAVEMRSWGEACSATFGEVFKDVKGMNGTPLFFKPDVSWLNSCLPQEMSKFGGWPFGFPGDSVLFLEWLLVNHQVLEVVIDLSIPVVDSAHCGNYSF